jgi:hypothetical protein
MWKMHVAKTATHLRQREEIQKMLRQILKTLARGPGNSPIAAATALG